MGLYSCTWTFILLHSLSFSFLCSSECEMGGLNLHGTLYLTMEVFDLSKTMLYVFYFSANRDQSHCKSLLVVMYYGKKTVAWNSLKKEVFVACEKLVRIISYSAIILLRGCCLLTYIEILCQLAEGLRVRCYVFTTRQMWTFLILLSSCCYFVILSFGGHWSMSIIRQKLAHGWQIYNVGQFILKGLSTCH